MFTNDPAQMRCNSWKTLGQIERNESIKYRVGYSNKTVVELYDIGQKFKRGRQ